MAAVALAGPRHIALILLLSTACYLRPSESVTQPVRGAGACHASWGIIMHEFEGEHSVASKTGAYDEGLLLDLPMHAPISCLLRDAIADR